MYSQIDSNKRKTVLLIGIFMLVIVAIGWAFSSYTDAGPGGVAIAGIVAGLMSFGSYYHGDKLALRTAGAQGPIQSNDNPYLFRLVENLTITAGLPMPKVFVISDPAINAFATGRDPQHASIAVTTGAIEKLANEELEGVLAHELSHIKNYDIRLMTVVVVLVGLAALLSDWFLRFHFFGGRRRSNERGGGVLMLVGVVLLVLSPIIGKLLQLAVSRRREFLADASGALLTRYPQGLASALEKISAESMPMQRASNATAHLFLSSPFGRQRQRLSRLFMTHPPIEDRIATLRAM